MFIRAIITATLQEGPRELRNSLNVVLPKHAADKLDGEKDKQQHNSMNSMIFKQDVNPLPKLSKGKWLPLDMQNAEQ